ncbi:hypothetical protein GCM10023210_33400 [Chryseobacterium ginsengisoli]|uniref:Uncharacterized protein n=1 Tax=Chryseobacterium ginsengisoli TaxID=363853 RepID=A0ABP9MK50_9FLAO
MKKQLLSAMAIVSLRIVFAQVGINTPNPNMKSTLDIISKNNNSGVLFPRLTTAQRDAINPGTTDAAVDGLWIYNTDTKCYDFWNRAQWISICGGSGGGSSTTLTQPLSGVKLMSYEQDPTYTFATTEFSEFFNSTDNFGTFPYSTVRTDGSSLVPDKVQYTNFATTNFQSYDIIGVSYRPFVDLTAAEVTAMVTFANTSKKHLYFFTENFNQTQKLNLLNQLIGDITLTSADIVGSVGANGDANTTNPCYFLTADPLNAPYVNGPFGKLQAGVHRFVDHAGGSSSFAYNKLSQSSNIQVIAADGLVNGIPQTNSKVGVFKIKNKNVFVIADGAPFYGGQPTVGPACLTPTIGGVRGRTPMKCGAGAANGTDSGVGILMANIVTWSLKSL